jgi:thioredoxin 1
MANTVAVTDGTFESEVLQSSTPVLVDFWAEWCQPCKMIAPHLEKIALEQEGKLKVAKVNVDENPQMMGAFRIRGIPTLILFKDGQPVETLVGFMPEKQILAKVEKHISAEATPEASRG